MLLLKELHVIRSKLECLWTKKHFICGSLLKLATFSSVCSFFLIESQIFTVDIYFRDHSHLTFSLNENMIRQRHAINEWQYKSLNPQCPFSPTNIFYPSAVPLLFLWRLPHSLLPDNNPHPSCGECPWFFGIPDGSGWTWYLGFSLNTCNLFLIRQQKKKKKTHPNRTARTNKN